MPKYKSSQLQLNLADPVSLINQPFSGINLAILIKTCHVVLWYQFLIRYISETVLWNFVKICDLYANQLVIEVPISIIDSEKLSCGYDDFAITSYGTCG